MTHFNLKTLVLFTALSVMTGMTYADDDRGGDRSGDRGDHDGDRSMESAALTMAQEATKPTSGPAQQIGKREFDRLVRGGELLPATLPVVLDQQLRTLRADRRNRRVIDEFIRKNPDLTGFAALVDLVPANPNVHRTLDGNYRTLLALNNGVSETIETNGQSTKLAQLANSILMSSDPGRQLDLYRSAYSRYLSFYSQFCGSPAGTVNAPAQGGCANLLSPTALTNPATLRDAPLQEIQTALTSIGTLGLGVLHMIPLPLGTGPVPCNEQVGASSAAGVNSFSGYGDQTQSAGYTTPSTSGIVGNFNFVNKNLLSCIKNQGQRGTCHIFAATSAIEELIARDTGIMVNLAEQDFMEHLKLLWTPAYYNDNGDAGFDIQTAAAQGYKFAYENQWDYNPSLNQPPPPAYEYQNTCENYPYPALEPSCSDSAPQALKFCTLLGFGTFAEEVCGYSPAVLHGSSPYSAVGANNVWNPKNPDLSVDYVYLALAFNDAVPMCFNATNNFEYGSPGGYIEYSAADNLTSIGGHCVHIVGFVSNADLAANPNTAAATPGSGGGYFIIKNSWSASFGDAGYVYMPVDYVKANAQTVYAVSSVND
jgi:C1A family cysteine protease